MTLAAPGEGLTLADGTIIMPDGRVKKPSRKPMVEVPSHSQAQAIVVNTRKRLADLPAVPQTMNAISVVLTYALFGLDDTEIAIATGFSVEQIGRIKTLEAYTQMQSAVVEQLLKNETVSVRSRIAALANSAVNKMEEALTDGPLDIAVSVARDVLDRSGNRAVDVVEHRHKMEGGLVIEVREKKHSDVPVIDLTAEVVNGNSERP